MVRPRQFKICEFCKEIFYRDKYKHTIDNATWNRRRFCSNRCRGKYTRMMSDRRRPFKQCELCKKTYFMPVDMDYKTWAVRKFCSNKCRLEWKTKMSMSEDRESKKCEFCHTVFYRNKYSINDISWNHRRFCSVKCWHASPEGKAEHVKSGEGRRLWGEKHPELVAQISKKTGAAASKWAKGHPEILFARGKIAGRRAVDTGQIFEIPKPKITYGFCGVEAHKHRSKLEITTCKRLQAEYDATNIHSCVKFGGREIDFVIAQNIFDAPSWFRAIEVHAKGWEKLTGKPDYAATRPSILRACGVTCPIEVIIK